MNSTPASIVRFIVQSIALLALICVGSLCVCAVSGIWIDGEIRGALISLTSSLVGALTAMLVNTRSTHDSTLPPTGEQPRKIAPYGENGAATSSNQPPEKP